MYSSPVKFAFQHQQSLRRFTCFEQMAPQFVDTEQQVQTVTNRTGDLGFIEFLCSVIDKPLVKYYWHDQITEMRLAVNVAWTKEVRDAYTCGRQVWSVEPPITELPKFRSGLRGFAINRRINKHQSRNITKKKNFQIFLETSRGIFSAIWQHWTNNRDFIFWYLKKIR